ncbi:MAG: hypothetical protein AAFV87_05495 [Pseudomonadota bacterium]
MADNWPLILSEEDATPTQIYAGSLALSRFVTALEKRGVTYQALPTELLHVAAYDTACGGLRSNGSRTSLRNLVVLEGVDFTREFLWAADAGSKHFGLNWNKSPFVAELEWLDLAGKVAATLLDDYDQPLHLLEGVNQLFFKNLLATKHWRETFLASLPEAMAGQISGMDQQSFDKHYAPTFAYVFGHPRLQIVPKERFEQAMDDCAKALRGTKTTGFWSALTRRVQ